MDSASIPPFSLSAVLAVSGAPGTPGAPGARGLCAWQGACGHDGEEGLPGSRGRDGGDLEVALAEREGKVEVRWNGQLHSLQLGHPEARCYVEAQGGDGGRGGAGGAGGRGGVGMSGHDATSHRQAGNGSQGFTGGKGGNGGAGGAGGRGGHLVVGVEEKDMDLLMLLEGGSVQGGRGGEGGEGGAGGKGGSGGEGGNSCQWTTQHRSHIYNDRMVVPVTYTRHHRRKGGVSGPRGEDGEMGVAGEAGQDGTDGSLEIRVSQGSEVKSYPGRYELELVDYTIQDGDGDGVLEPEESVSLRLKVRNSGAMPFPLHQRVRVVEEPNRFTEVLGKEPVWVPLGLAPGEECWLEGRLGFRVMAPAVPNFAGETRLGFKAVVERVNKTFPGFGQEGCPVKLGYPAVLTPLRGLNTLAEGEDVPLEFAVKNVSERVLGEGAGRRALRVRLAVEKSHQGSRSDFCFVDGEGSCLPPGQALVWDIDRLEAGERRELRASIRLAEGTAARLGRRVEVVAAAALGVDEGAFMTVAKRRHQLRLTPAFASSASPLLLVIHGATTQKELEAWKTLFREMGVAEPVIWNQARFGGLDLECPVPDQQGSSLSQRFAGKTLVILNTSMETEKEQVMDYVSMGQLFRAARDHRVNTYIVGGQGVRAEEGLVPQDDADLCLHNGEEAMVLALREEDQECPAPHRHLWTVSRPYKSRKTPKEKHLRKLAVSLNERLARHYPDQLYMVVYDYRPTKEGAKEGEWLLGSIEAMASLKKSEASLMVYKGMEELLRTPLLVADTHVYNLYKLFQFQDKLNLVATQCPNGRYRQRLYDALLSDLTEEQKVYRQAKWDGPLSRRDIKKGLDKLEMLVAHPCLQEGEEEFVGRVLLDLRRLVKELTGMRDCILPSRRSKTVSDESCQLINRRLSQLPSGLLQRLKAEGDRFHGQVEKEKRMEVYLNPLFLTEDIVVQDNRLEVTERVMTKAAYDEVVERDRCTPLNLESFSLRRSDRELLR